MAALARQSSYKIYRSFQLANSPVSTKISIYLNNELNSKQYNYPGFDVRVGGVCPEDESGIIVHRDENYLRYDIEPEQNLKTWFKGCNYCKNYDWIEFTEILGPFVEGQWIVIPRI